MKYSTTGKWLMVGYVIFLSVFIGTLGDAADTASAKPEHHRAKWMADGSYGVMVHYLMAPGGETAEAKTAELNRIIDGFDLETFMKQFEDSGADWLIFTIGQNTGYFNSSNSELDRLLPGRTPKRDLVLQIAQRVKAMHKRFIVYLPAPVISPMEKGVQQVFGWDPDKPERFLKGYPKFIRAYSEKLGLLCDGWWFDGCYDWINKGRWDWADWATYARAGNPDSAVALNDGAFCIAREKPVSPLQDYHSGEVHMLYKGQIVFGYPAAGGFKMSQEGKLLYEENPSRLYMPTSQYIDGVQWHALVPVDSSFNAPTIPYSACHYSDEELLQFIRGCKAVKGAVTLNVPVDITGHIPLESAAQLKRIGQALRNTK